MHDDHANRDLLDRISAAPLSERATADAMAKWTAEDLKAIVEVIAPDDCESSDTEPL